MPFTPLGNTVLVEVLLAKSKASGGIMFLDETCEKLTRRPVFGRGWTRPASKLKGALLLSTGGPATLSFTASGWA